nr:gamma-aminobutyric acid receptor subunit beta-like [Cherax quadricarinatus]
MCDNGECIDLAARCDAKSDCNDETDEDNCSLLQVPAGYRSFKPPKNVGDPSKPLQPNLIFNFLRFLKIEDVEETINLEFIVNIEWRDSRLTYTNLREDIHANKLSKIETESIWKPKLKFPNVKDGKLQKLEEIFYIQKNNDSLTSNFNAVNMDVTYMGASAVIIQREHYSGSFVCDFNVFYYPFDVQQCSVLVQLSSVNEELVTFTTEKTTVHFDKSSKFGTYIIQDFVTLKQKSKSPESLFKIGYTLQRQSTLIVLNIYLPSIILMVIGYLTLFVHVQKLDVRLGVSLTTLLVLYTFFNQTSSSLPQTAYVKMIDVWFFFCTLLLFVIIMVHVIVEGLETEAVVRIGPLRRKQGIRISAEILLRVVRQVAGMTPTLCSHDSRQGYNKEVSDQSLTVLETVRSKSCVSKYHLVRDFNSC